MATYNLDAADLAAQPYQGLINEDVMQQIFDISRIPLPFTDMISADDASNQYTEWTVDELAAPNIANAKVDGIDVDDDDTVRGDRMGNHCQISTKMVKVSHRADDVDTIGRAKELSYQVMRRQQELRRDVEATMLTGQASIADDGDSVAGLSAGFAAWIVTAANRGAGGTGTGFNNTTGVVAAVADGTKRAITETMIKDAIEAVYQEGGDVTYLMSVPSVIRLISEYMFTSSARIATLQSDIKGAGEKATAMGSVNVFVSDFGTVTFVPNRLQQLTGTADAASVYLFDPSYVRQAFLGGYRTEPLAKTGLSEKRLMCVDWTLKVLNEKAHAIIADVDVAIPMTS